MPNHNQSPSTYNPMNIEKFDYNSLVAYIKNSVQSANKTNIKRTQIAGATRGLVTRHTAVTMQQLESGQFDWLPNFELADMYSMLSDVLIDNDAICQCLIKSAKNFSISDAEPPVTRLLHNLYQRDTARFLKEFEAINSSSLPPLFRLQLLEVFIKQTTQEGIARTGLTALLERANVSLTNIDLFKILCNHNIIKVTEHRETILSPGNFCLENERVEIRPAARRNNDDDSQDELDVCLNNETLGSISKIISKHDIGEYCLKALRASVDAKKLESVECYLNYTNKFSPQLVPSILSGYYGKKSLFVNVLKLNLVKNNKMETLFSEKLDIDAMEAFDLANFFLGYQVRDHYGIVMASIVIAKNKDYANEIAEQNKNTYPATSRLLSFLMNASDFEPRNEMHRNRALCYYYSHFSNPSSCLLYYTNFVKDMPEVAHRDALDTELQNDAPLYCAELLNQLAKHSASPLEVTTSLRQQALQLYQKGGNRQSAAILKTTLTISRKILRQQRIEDNTNHSSPSHMHSSHANDGRNSYDFFSQSSTAVNARQPQSNQPAHTNGNYFFSHVGTATNAQQPQSRPLPPPYYTTNYYDEAFPTT